MNESYKIFSIGIHKENSVKENKRIKLLNIFCFTWCLMIPVITLFDVIFKREIKESLILHGISYLLIIGVFFFQSKKHYTLARTLFICSIIGVTFVFANYVSPLNLIENFYFIYPLISLILIDKKWINISVLILCFLLYFGPNFFFNHYPDGMILPVLVLCVFSGAFVILNYSDSLNKKNEKKILEGNRKLETAYLELEERKKSELAKLQLKALRTQMNPHFMFNAINSIQNLILKEEKEDAYNYLTKFSSYLRDNLNNSDKSLISFKEEILILKKYLDLEKLRFRDDFEYTIQGEETIENIQIPVTVIQLFIEDIIRNKLLHKIDEIKKLSITFCQNEVLECTILNNGKYIDGEEKEKVKKYEFLEERVSILNDYYKININFKLVDIESGSKIVLRIPYFKNFKKN